MDEPKYTDESGNKLYGYSQTSLDKHTQTLKIAIIVFGTLIGILITIILWVIYYTIKHNVVNNIVAKCL